jgi:hypothetical protein
MAERFLYLPAVAFAGCLAAALWGLRERVGARGMQAVCAVVALLFAARTFARNFDWMSEASLFQSAAAAVPESFRPHTDMTSIDLRANKLDEAAREAGRSLEILAPLADTENLPAPYLTAAAAYSAMADSLRPADAAPWWAKSIAALERAERIAGSRAADLSQIYQNLGYAQMRSGAFDAAIATLEKAMRKKLDVGAFINLATAYQGKGDARNAQISILEATIWRRQDNAIATNLLKIFRAAEPETCALTANGESYRLNTACPLVQNELCTASSRLIARFETQGNAAEVERVRTAAQHAKCAN